jgi:hypothetical protein
MPHDLLDLRERHLAHLLGFEIADWMRQFDVGMSFHAFAAKLEYTCVLERLCDNHGRRHAALLEFYGVMHTAQRARPSSAYCGNRDIYFVRHLVDERLRCRF